jgi:pyrroline-5-carboxylate reductase
MPLSSKTIGFIGAGAMAEALIKSLLCSGLVKPGNILASDVNIDRGLFLQEKYGISFLSDNKELIKKVNIAVLSVKPMVMNNVLTEVSPHANNQQLFISIAAGVSIDTIVRNLPEGCPVIRVMPNTPCLIGEGASAYATGKFAGPREEEYIKEILETTGISVKVPEHLLNAVTGLSGSGPAYVFMFLEALIDGGVKSGLPRDIAAKLATQTLIGAAKMVQETGEHPAKLKDMVTTPGGTTIAGLHALEEGRLRSTVMDAVNAAVTRANELGLPKS